MYDNKAKVIQQEDMKQFVFSYRCAKNKGKCLGISQLYESECTERFGWMYMYYKPENKPPQWGFVNGKLVIKEINCVQLLLMKQCYHSTTSLCMQIEAQVLPTDHIERR